MKFYVGSGMKNSELVNYYATINKVNLEVDFNPIHL